MMQYLLKIAIYFLWAIECSFINKDYSQFKEFPTDRYIFDCSYNFKGKKLLCTAVTLTFLKLCIASL